MSDSNSSPTTQTTSNLTSLDRRVGVEGPNARVLGDGASATDSSGLNGGTAPISAGAGQYTDTGDIFSPTQVFNFGGGNTANSSIYSTEQQQAIKDFLTAHPENQQTLSGAFGGNLDAFGQWFAGRTDATAPWDAALQEQIATPAGTAAGGNSLSSGGTNSPSINAPNINQAGADSSVASGGDLNGAIAAGSDSIAVQSDGGAVSLGDNSPIINIGSSGIPSSQGSGATTAPVATGSDSVAQAVSTGGGLVAGGDATNSAPIVTNNSGTVEITNTDADVATAAINGSKSNLSDSLGFANRALDAVASATKDPAAAASAQQVQALTIIALGLGALYFINRHRAA